jgi:hypothetical protein
VPDEGCSANPLNNRGHDTSSRAVHAPAHHQGNVHDDVECANASKNYQRRDCILLAEADALADVHQKHRWCSKGTPAKVLQSWRHHLRRGAHQPQDLLAT